MRAYNRDIQLRIHFWLVDDIINWTWLAIGIINIVISSVRIRVEIWKLYEVKVNLSRRHYIFWEHDHFGTWLQEHKPI